MRIGVIPDKALERIAVAMGLVPTPLLEGFVGLIAARTLVAATRLGIFDAIGGQSLTSDELAARLNMHPLATEQLLGSLIGSGHLEFGSGHYSLSRSSRRWLRATSPDSAVDGILSASIAGEALDHLEEFIRSGHSVDFHESHHSSEDWALYQRGMRSTSAGSISEVARRTPVPKGARFMIDIGGGHGLHSITLCKRHPELRAMIIDLPQAIEPIQHLLEAEGLGERVTYQAADIRSFDLGEERFDFAFMSQVAHHFDAPTNQELACRIARALTPGGVFVIQEFVRPASVAQLDQVTGLLNLFFGLTSRSGSWSLDETAGWLREAGLRPLKPIHLRTAPGVAQQPAVKAPR